MASGESKRPFSVHESGAVRKRFLRLQLQAILEGRGKAMLRALRGILQRLQSDPLEFGESLYPLRHMKLQVFTCSLRPLVLDYAVSVEHHMVFIKEIRLLEASSIDSSDS